MINKKAEGRSGTLTIGTVMAIFIAILLGIFLFGGGVSTAFNITRFLKSIPTPVWVVLGIIFLFKLLGRRRR